MWFRLSSHRLILSFLVQDAYLAVLSSSDSSVLSIHPFTLNHFTPPRSSFTSRLRYYPESALPSQSVHGELPVGGDRAVPAQEEAAHPKPADPAQPERALRGCKRPGHQDPAQEMQLPQEQGVSARTQNNAINLKGDCQKGNMHTKL